MPADRPEPPAVARVATAGVGRPTRRGALLASTATVGLVTTACGGSGPDAAPTPTGGVPAGARVPEGDDAVLAAVREELAAAHALVAATLDRHRPLREPLGELQATRAAQLTTLDPDGEAPAPEQPRVPRDPATALGQVRVAEERLQRRLLTWAVAVDSGPLARVLAAAAAGTAQHLAVLPGGELA